MVLRPLVVLTTALALLLCAAGPVTAAGAAPLDPDKRAQPSKRKGGKVRSAWPRGRAGKPATALERWLARQVGPRRPRPCARLRRCRTRRVFAKSQAEGSASIRASAASDPLALVRSYDIPAGDPSYDRLLNWSWTYDSAVTAAAFAASGVPAQSERLLDQLKALQRSDGSIDTAFNVYTGEGTGQLRSGTVAWTGLAAATYSWARRSSRYDQVATDAARWLLAQRDLRSDSPTYGLVKGGPDADWYSTQHNLIAYALFTKLAIDGTFKGSKDMTYWNAAAGVANGIDTKLLVQPSASTAYFREGYGDDVRPLDTQALGALYLVGRGRASTAEKVRAYVDANYALSNRTIAKSTVPSTFNNSYTAAGPFTGYRPYADAGSPDVVWAEGTAQVRLLRSALDEPLSTLDASVKTWDKVTTGAGPLQADRTVTGNSFNEYHVWPAAAPAAWRILSGAPADFFVVVGGDDE